MEKIAAKTHPGLLALGGGYFVPLHEVTLIAPIKAVGDIDIDEDKVVDTTIRHKPQTAIFTRSDRTIVSHLAPDEVAERYAKANLALTRAEAERKRRASMRPWFASRRR